MGANPKGVHLKKNHEKSLEDDFHALLHRLDCGGFTDAAAHVSFALDAYQRHMEESRAPLR